MHKSLSTVGELLTPFAMRFLAVFLLVCLGVAAAVPLYPDSDDFDDLDEFIVNSEGGGRIGERLKELFEKIVEKIKKSFDEGKGVRGDLMKKVSWHHFDWKKFHQRSCDHKLYEHVVDKIAKGLSKRIKKHSCL
ncbi:uncharacterized protein TNIN_26461 [Trichonephila inaurata madagascariensis]|uniref:Uncharacterized protein n=1 Tax=Trichonephila inaurata madagascariensis TaxID=2747483 RepID=A0A8X6I6G9_9ARAC|nr:uncharacterized protein TNIN_26461 [Trichonephila inaurata madagascariensis]